MELLYNLLLQLCCFIDFVEASHCVLSLEKYLNSDQFSTLLLGGLDILTNCLSKK